MKYDVVVKPAGLGDAGLGSIVPLYGVYGETIADDGTVTLELIEDGFLSKASAYAAARDYLSDLVGAMERKAGWDPNP